MRSVAGVRRSQDGQSLVELALLLPVLLLIVMGIIDLGRVFNAYIVITNSARMAARYGAQCPNDPTGITASALAEASGSGIVLDVSRVTISSSGVPGTSLTVNVSHPFSAISTFISSFWGGGDFMITSHAIMMVESDGSQVDKCYR